MPSHLLVILECTKAKSVTLISRFYKGEGRGALCWWEIQIYLQGHARFWAWLTCRLIWWTQRLWQYFQLSKGSRSRTGWHMINRYMFVNIWKVTLLPTNPTLPSLPTPGPIPQFTTILDWKPQKNNTNFQMSFFLFFQIILSLSISLLRLLHFRLTREIWYWYSNLSLKIEKCYP